MENSQKERIDRELRFLKGSLDAGIISREEYEKGVQRIEKKKLNLKEEAEPEPKISDKAAEQIFIKEITEEGEEAKEKGAEAQDSPMEEEGPGDMHPKEPEEKEREVSDFFEQSSKKEPEEKKKKKIGKTIIWVLVIIGIIILVISISSKKLTSEVNKTPQKELIKEMVPICNSDSDCDKEGKIGTCSNPGMDDANCQYAEPVKIGLTIVNDKNCQNCDTSRMLSVIQGLFPGVESRTVDYSDPEGKRLVSMYRIDALPAYIFDRRINETLRFESFKQALVNEQGSFLIRNSASGANYYFKREKIANRLELFSLANQTGDLDKILAEVSLLFGDKINIVRTVVNDAMKNSLENELGITTYPAFLVNNQLKFGGVQPPETIKNIFCELNPQDKCRTILSMVIS